MLSVLSRARHSFALPTPLRSRHASFRGPQKITRQAGASPLPPQPNGAHGRDVAHSSSLLNVLRGRDLPTVASASERWSLSPGGAVWLLVAMNGLVAYKLAAVNSEDEAESVAIHCFTSRSHINGGLYHTLLTSVFSHDNYMHLITDMLGIYLFGRGVAPVLGTKRFLAFFAMSSIMTSWVEVQRQRRTGQGFFYHGASGPVNALAILNVCIMPQSTLLFFKLIPVQPWVALALWLTSDVIGMREDPVHDNSHVVEA